MINGYSQKSGKNCVLRNPGEYFGKACLQTVLRSAKTEDWGPPCPCNVALAFGPQAGNYTRSRCTPYVPDGFHSKAKLFEEAYGIMMEIACISG